MRSTFSKNKQIRKTSVAVVFSMAILLLPTLIAMPLVATAFSSQHRVPLSFHDSDTFSSSGLFQSQAGLSKGRFLVASRQLKDPNFFETVVLLLDYDSHGAMGLVINRPTQVRVSTVLPDVEGLQQLTDIVFVGGPVARTHMLLLIRTSNPPEGSHPVLDDTYISSNQTVLQRMIDDKDHGERVRVYAGYAGWAPGQLDQEVSRKDWHVLQADSETIFDKDPSEIWPTLIRQSPVLVVKTHEPTRGSGPLNVQPR